MYWKTWKTFESIMLREASLKSTKEEWEKEADSPRLVAAVFIGKEAYRRGWSWAPVRLVHFPTWRPHSHIYLPHNLSGLRAGKWLQLWERWVGRMYIPRRGKGWGASICLGSTYRSTVTSTWWCSPVIISSLNMCQEICSKVLTSWKVLNNLCHNFECSKCTFSQI